METKAYVLKSHSTIDKSTGQNEFDFPVISKASSWFSNKLLSVAHCLVTEAKAYMEWRNRVKTEEEIRASSEAFKEELIASFMFK